MFSEAPEPDARADVAALEAPLWSIIIPACNEEDRLGPTLGAIQSFMDRRGEPYELIVVDDGSTDRTPELVRDEFPEARLLRNPGNRGKGYSVRAGLLEANGQWALFSDADLSTPIEELPRFAAELEAGADVAIASRAMPESVIEVHQVWWREMSGRLFNFLVRFLSGLPFRDTQCGFKAYTQEAAREIASRQRVEGWAFDIEQLMLARLLGMDVREIPVHWKNSPASRLQFFRDAPRMLIDTIRIRLSFRNRSKSSPESS